MSRPKVGTKVLRDDDARENWWRYAGGFTMGVILTVVGLSPSEWRYWPPLVVLVVVAEVAYSIGKRDGPSVGQRTEAP